MGVYIVRDFFCSAYVVKGTLVRPHTMSTDPQLKALERIEIILEELLSVMSSTSSKEERAMKRENVIELASLYFVVPTFIVGLYGMNIRGLPLANHEWIVFIMGLSILLWCGFVYVFIQRRYSNVV